MFNTELQDGLNRAMNNQEYTCISCVIEEDIKEFKFTIFCERTIGGDPGKPLSNISGKLLSFLRCFFRAVCSLPTLVNPPVHFEFAM